LVMISVPVSANDAAGSIIMRAMSAPAAVTIDNFIFMVLPLL
jgi:hypothetical protein